MDATFRDRIDSTDRSSTVDSALAIDAIALESVATLPISKNAQPLHPVNQIRGETDNLEAMIGDRIGPYLIVTPIGRGELGNVYRANSDDEFVQQVAIKVIDLGPHGDVILRRFQSQAHVQAALDRHPNISALFDAGITQNGQAYVVTPYVDGQRIDEYCDNRRLDIAARIKLFAHVCEAVHFAHQNAILHRDLKPSNILVTSDGVPKVVDFDVAKLVQPEPAGDEATSGTTATLTGSGGFVLTPEYASPEQVKGEPVTTASDIYALGVLLYHLLSGHNPYQLATSSTSDIFQAICEQVPERPSTAISRRLAEGPASRTDQLSLNEIAAARGLTPVRLKRALTGDLDLIVSMAMSKEPERRYASAERFSDDLHRYLKGFPAQAHRDSPVHRASKFMQRHAIAAALLLSLVMATGIVGTMKGLMKMRHDRELAADSFQKGGYAINQLFARVSEERLLNQPGAYPLRNSLLKDAQRFYEDFINQASNNHSLRAELATAQASVAKIISLTGTATGAISRYQQAVDLWEKLVAEHPDNPDYQANLAQTLTDFGTVLLPLDGQLDAALGVLLRAQTLVEALIAADPQSAPRRRELGRILLNIAEIQRQQGTPDDAIISLQRVLAIVSQLDTEEPESLESRIALAEAYSRLGRLLAGQPAELREAMTDYEQAIEIQGSVNQEHPELPEQAYRLASDLSDLNVLQQKMGQSNLALENLSRALHIFEQIAQLYPHVAPYQKGLGTTYNMMSNLEAQRGEKAAALEFAQKARTLFERLLGGNPKNNNSRLNLAKSDTNIGRLQRASGQA